MSTVSAQFNRDANNVPIDGLGFTETKAITYSALTTGAVGATTLFTVTGVVAIRLFGVVSGADLTGADFNGATYGKTVSLDSGITPGKLGMVSHYTRQDIRMTQIQENVRKQLDLQMRK